MTMVSVPGTGGSVITYNFTNAENTALAVQIAHVLNTALASGNLNVAAYAGASTAPTVGGVINELAVSTSSAAVPPGYTYAADSTGGGNLLISGVQNFIGGDGNIGVSNTSIGGGVDTIALGNGADTVWLVQGSTYDAAAGNGNDIIVGSGSGTISGGTGANFIFVGNSCDTIPAQSNLVFSNGTDTVVAYGNATVAATGNALIFNESSNLNFLNGPATVVSGPNTTSTIVGGLSNNPELVFGNNFASQVVFANSDSFTFVADTNDSATIVGGAAPVTLFGGESSSVTYFGSVGGALFVADSGNETLMAAGSSSNNTVWGGTGAESLVGGSGNDLMVAGTGSDTMAGGTGNNMFDFLATRGAGSHTITDYSASDVVNLIGYGTAAGAAAIAAATVSGGATKITLSDNTSITFLNVTDPNSLQINSV